MLYKYPRTPHLPFSEGCTSGDKKLKSTDHLKNMEIVVTEKMDGENTTIYKDYYHARSLDSKHQEYHSYLLSKIIPGLQYFIPDGWRVCGEYLYARHTIYYNNLKDYFLGFGIYDDKNNCLSWDETKRLFENWGVNYVKEFYCGLYNDDIVKKIAEEAILNGSEGIVLRNVNSFSYDDFGENTAKYVQANFVKTDDHWTTQKIEKNNLAK